LEQVVGKKTDDLGY